MATPNLVYSLALLANKLPHIKVLVPREAAGKYLLTIHTYTNVHCADGQSLVKYIFQCASTTCLLCSPPTSI